MITTFNYYEAGLWFVIAIAMAVGSRRKPANIRRIAFVAAVAFAVFGVSDLIEAKTGTWWTPWWLFVMKAACFLVLATCLWRYQRSKHSQPHDT